MERFAGGGFFLGIAILVGLGRVLPDLHYTPKFSLIVQHVIAVAHLAIFPVLDVDPFARLAHFSPELWGKGTSVDFLFWHGSACDFAKGRKKIREIDEVVAG